MFIGDTQTCVTKECSELCYKLVGVFLESCYELDDIVCLEEGKLEQ